MSEVPQKISKKERVMKSLAVAGFIGIIILIAWLSIQLVSVMPSAFSSLASLAEVVHRTEQPASPEPSESAFIQVSSSETLLNTGDPVTVSWVTSEKSGTYTFSYTCVPGIAINVIDNEYLQGIDCGTTYNIGAVDSLTFAVDSEKERYTDVAYTIAFLGTNDQNPQASGSASLTIINNDIENILGQTDEETPVTQPVEETVTEPEVTTPQAPSTPPAVTTPSVEQHYIYAIPTSDPNGKTDIGVRYVAAGTIINNIFYAGTIKQNSDGAIQFAVKNYGTKTSNSWKFSVSLPDGSTYQSDSQLPLKPNEQSMLTIGFPVSNKSGHTFVIRITEPTDQNTLNDAASQFVTFIK